MAVRQDRKVETLAFLLAWIPYALLVKLFWFVGDDAFISFRYARNWVLGHGLRYNLGDHVPVEGYSNFLWVIWCGILVFLGWNVPFWACITSFAAGSVLLYLVFAVLYRRLELNLPVATVATMSLGMFPPSPRRARA